jgi:hypothetical protein
MNPPIDGDRPLYGMPIVQWERTDSLKQAELCANEISQTFNGEEAHTNDQPPKETK